MHKLISKIQKHSTSSVVCFLFSTAILSMVGTAVAQAAPVAAAEAANTASTSSQNTAAENTDNFADIADLGEQIAVAQRKIQAMTLKNSLDALQAQQTMGTFPFKVLRIEGFGNNLYAILSDDTGVVYQAGPGDIIANQYRISLIRPFSVGVVDITTHKSYAVPFVIGGMDGLSSDFSNGSEESTPSSAPVPVPTSTASSKQ